MFSISDRPTIAEIHALYSTKKATPSQVVQFFFNRDKKLDKTIKAFIYFTEELATKTALEQDKILESSTIEEIKKTHPLFGIPCGLKSIVQLEGEVFNSASKILDNFKSPYSSTVSKKLLEAGAIVIGINNMDSHAMGASGENSDWGPTKNPFDNSRTCGGSSCGSAGAVASGQVVFSIGTDTGGSIRQPAAFTDTVGIKTTYGLVSRWGVQPMASSLDQPGPITNSVEDNLIVTKVISGQDKNDLTSLDSQELITRLEKLIEDKNTTRIQNKITKTNKPLRIGIVKEFMIDGIEPQIKQGLDSLITKLEEIGHTIVPLSIPIIEEALGIYYLTMSVEVASNLQRIDGVRYAKQPAIGDSDELYFDHRNNNFPTEAKRRIILGSYASSAGYFDAYYNQSQRARALAIDEFKKAFEQCDVILAPVTPEFPFKLGEKTDDPIKMYLSDIFTCIINPIKIPSLAIPIGFFPVKENVYKVFDELSAEDKKLPLASIRERSIALIKIKDEDKFVVFRKNIDSKEFYNNPEFRYLPGGMIESGETTVEAAMRETLEEVGINNLEFVSNIATCQKLLRYENEIGNGIEHYCLFETDKANFENRAASEADDKGYAVELATLEELRNNNWSQLNWVIDILEGKKKFEDESKTVMLPTGCQIMAPELHEDVIYNLGFEIEKLTNN
jgi:aspartyl-tRNA(Asn)/glutamyl-tRNA(Gln) amidotransferase subunit A